MSLLKTFAAALAAGACLLNAQARAGEGAPEQPNAPYFFLGKGDPALDRLPLKSTHAEVRIAGVIAEVRLTQRYRNEGSRPIEARYVFPASTRAAVNGLTMRLADRVVEATIREKHQARAEYEVAKAEGKSAALLEQHRPNVFGMNVANIMPGDDIAVELRYTETLPPAEGHYRFVLPTVVGPRYGGAPGGSGAAAGTAWAAQPTLPAGEPTTATFSAEVVVDSPIPVKSLYSPSHPMGRVESGERRVTLRLPPAAEHGNRDFTVDYQLAGEGVESGVLVQRGAEENFFMALIEPPVRVSPEALPPRDYVFIVDISGSMHGFPLDTAKRLLTRLVGGLRPVDTFNVMLFAGDNSVLAPASLPATRENVATAIAMINRQRGGGGTELLPAMKKALALPREENRARSFVVVTDGYVVIEQQAFDLVREKLNEANVFAFGIGSTVNRFLIEGLARAGRGEAFIVEDPSVAEEQAERFRRYVEAPLWTHLKLNIEGFDAYDLEPAVLPDLFASRPVVVTGKFRGPATGRITVEGHTGAGLESRSVEVHAEEGDGTGRGLAYLWARQRIAALSDTTKLGFGGDPATVQAITDLGLKYHLLTDYTSFIAVDRVVRNTAGSTAVDQPLPMPQGVSNLAVGGGVPSTPEPEFYALAALATALGAWSSRRRTRRAEQAADREQGRA